MRKELGVTEEQEKALISERGRLAQERRNLMECDRELERFRMQAKQYLKDMHDSLEKCGGHLSTQQLARFVVWVQRNIW